MSLPLNLPLNTGETRLLRGLEEQQALGAAFALALPTGALLFLEGELGAGKTSFTQGLVGALGFRDSVTSPTYALMHVYPTAQGQVLHVDAYRVRDVGELYDMDLDDLISGSRLSVVEWGEGLYADYQPAPILRFAHVDGQPEVREVTRIR
ncbi:tRNA (adenosine(37)-N6)-threonylcarbamoyltransferase complex ATPase subunit type 1 TsaE [Deinococcus fonticola]|uniref:tRNA (adenosine(37)-N6)-threonylcarbamoyltransferase complex ATPase subunit type 1 TsaE n=1 Tax=Deinococcus fonticola TaxID=2528713 RepID=UPI001074F61C|nr:tRNA (adenosine(37)-N6)-threonylcarbamoyltransferase complex ATPase subunit type 1 TsaE [Deinococcus fonticola]